MQYCYKLSIIIPHYNSFDLLVKLLSTIPDEKYIQTIVIDDHSNEIVKEQLHVLQNSYAGNNLVILNNETSEHNAGASRNIGLDYAEGEWLLFADADDYFLNGFYETIKGYFDSDFDIVFFAPISIEIDTGREHVRYNEYNDYIDSYLKDVNVLTEVALRYQWAVPWSKLIRNSLVQSNEITFESVRLYNDILFSCKTGYRAKKITVCKNNIYCVTRNKGSLTTKLDLESFEIQTGVKIEQYNFLKKNLTKEEFKASYAYRIAWGQLFLILRRKYGLHVFFKYIKIFRKDKMLRFDFRLFSRIGPRKMIRERHEEKEIRERYEE